MRSDPFDPDGDLTGSKNSVIAADLRRRLRRAAYERACSPGRMLFLRAAHRATRGIVAVRERITAFWWAAVTALHEATQAEADVDRFVLRRWNGAVSLEGTRRAAVFCHYHPQGEFPDECRQYLAALHKEGFAIVLVSSAPCLSARDVEALQKITSRIVHRQNIGHDFGCYQAGLHELAPFTRFEMVVIANDSVYGAFERLGAVLGRCTEEADIWGATDSADISRHLQSYFLCVRASALQHPQFAKFWRTYSSEGGRQRAIHLGELGFSRRMTNAGLRLKAVYSQREAIGAFFSDRIASGATPLIPSRGASLTVDHIFWLALEQPERLNPTHFFWRQLIEMGCPFVKRDFADANPMRISDAAEWSTVLAARFEDADRSCVSLPR